MKHTFWRHDPLAKTFAALVLLALLTGGFLTGGFLWLGGLPARELPRGQVEAFLAVTVVKPSFGGTVFCVPDVLGTRLQGTPSDVVIKEYVYADCQEYYSKAGRLEQGTGARVPVVITARRDGDGYSLLGSQAATDDGGGLEIFPPLIRWRLAAAERSAEPAGPSAQAAVFFRL